MRLTDITIRALEAPEQGATIYADDQLSGFGVRVSQAGAKSFVITYTMLSARSRICEPGETMEAGRPGVS